MSEIWRVKSVKKKHSVANGVNLNQILVVLGTVLILLILWYLVCQIVNGM